MTYYSETSVPDNGYQPKFKGFNPNGIPNLGGQRTPSLRKLAWNPSKKTDPKSAEWLLLLRYASPGSTTIRKEGKTLVQTERTRPICIPLDSLWAAKIDYSTQVPLISFCVMSIALSKPDRFTPFRLIIDIQVYKVTTLKFLPGLLSLVFRLLIEVSSSSSMTNLNEGWKLVVAPDSIRPIWGRPGLRSTSLR